MHVKTPAACALAPLHAFWEHWGFEPWSHGNLQGVCRLQRFVKDGFLGPIAEYRAWDCIVWNAGGAEDRDCLWKSLRPLPDVMTQRFLFLLDVPWPRRRIRSFWCGIKGYAEFYAFSLSSETSEEKVEPQDLTDLVRLGMRLSRQQGVSVSE